jgi:hypothetical protein
VVGVPVVVPAVPEDPLVLLLPGVPLVPEVPVVPEVPLVPAISDIAIVGLLISARTMLYL